MQDAAGSDFLAHFESPYHRGRLAEPSATQHLRNAACGDWVNLEVRLAGEDRVEAVYFGGINFEGKLTSLGFKRLITYVQE